MTNRELIDLLNDGYSVELFHDTEARQYGALVSHPSVETSFNGYSKKSPRAAIAAALKDLLPLVNLQPPERTDDGDL